MTTGTKIGSAVSLALLCIKVTVILFFMRGDFVPFLYQNF